VQEYLPSEIERLLFKTQVIKKKKKKKEEQSTSKEKKENTEMKLKTKKINENKIHSFEEKIFRLTNL
jgi:hypothetical protein